MDLNLRGKRAFISGSTSGIGFATAKMLLTEGVEVYINGRSSENVIKAVNDLKTQVDGAKVFGLVADFNNPQEVEALFTQLSEVDILINNAGITGPTAPLWEYDIDMWNKIVQINLVGTFNCCRAIVPNMIKNCLLYTSDAADE